MEENTGNTDDKKIFRANLLDTKGFTIQTIRGPRKVVESKLFCWINSGLISGDKIEFDEVDKQ